ncbi:MAG TPA: o-succinylbenzoate synthase [Acidimicrobiales bacterium]
MGSSAQGRTPSSSPLATWSALGEGSRLRLTGAEVTQVELDLRRPVGTALGSHTGRPVVMVQLVAEGPGGRTVGWGECAALADTTFDKEDADGAFKTLTQDLLPRLTSGSSSETPPGAVPLPGPSSLAERVRPPGVPLAFAALEMAVADVHLRASGISLAEVLGVTGSNARETESQETADHRDNSPKDPDHPDRLSVPVGAVVGTTGRVETLLDQVDEQVDRGFARVKLKIGPGWDVVPVTAVRRRHPDLMLQVDANGSYSRTDVTHLTELDGLDLACIEQPFGSDDLEGHALLARSMRTPVCLDESLHSPDSVRSALAMGACEVVCVKPARLGGLTAALEVYRDCADAGAPMWVGGMFESGYARSVNTALAALPGFVLPGDLAPAANYLTEDLVAAPLVHRQAPDGRLRVAVHLGPGLAPAPDHEVLARRTVASWSWSAG